MKFIPQFDASDCGPACVAMIAWHYGRRLSLTQMRERAGTDRNSTNLKGLLQAADSVGLEAQAVKGEAGSLTPEVPVPCIAHVRKGQHHHFVVIYKIGKTRIRVADPDPQVGKVTYSHEEFHAIWTGYLVLLSRGEHFSRTRDNPGLFARFLPLLRPHAGTIANTVVASIVITILGVAGAMYFRFLVDDVLFSESRLTLHVISTGVVIITLMQVVLNAVRPQHRTGVMANAQGVLVGLIDGWGVNLLFWIGSVLILDGHVSLGISAGVLFLRNTEPSGSAQLSRYRKFTVPVDDNTISDRK